MDYCKKVYCHQVSEDGWPRFATRSLMGRLVAIGTPHQNKNHRGNDKATVSLCSIFAEDKTFS